MAGQHYCDSDWERSNEEIPTQPPKYIGAARHLQPGDGGPAAAVAGERGGRAALPDGQQVRPLRRPRGRRLPGVQFNVRLYKGRPQSCPHSCLEF